MDENTNNNETAQTPERFSKELIEEYKKIHGKIFLYTAEDGKKAILKAPSLQIIDACRAVSNGSSIRFDMALQENCWVDGDKELLTIDKYRMGLFDHLGGIIVKVRGSLGEL